MTKKVAIIGAGCSGLAGIKCCLEEGLEPVCFERESDIGGLWNYTEKVTEGRGGIYRSCVINTSKEMMAFSDFPVPAEYPNFMPHEYVLKYFQAYMEHFGLKRYIQFNTSVENIIPADDYETSGKWEVVTQAKVGKKEKQTFHGVLICTGHHCHPHIPDFMGIENFSGIKMHTHEYRTPEIFEGKKVLVIGIGNSAVDVAVDLARMTKQVYLSTRRGAWVVSRMGPFGIPADVLANSRFMFSFPNSWLQWMVEKMANFRFDHDVYGVKPQHGALEAHPTINDELPYEIMKGRVQVLPDIDFFDSDSVVFADGHKEHIDAVVFATGYNYKFSFLDESVLNIQKNDVALYKYTFPPNLKHGTLAVVGLVQAIGAVIPISEMQCRWFSQTMAGVVKLPPKAVMENQILCNKKRLEEQYVSSQRHTLETFWIEFMDDLASEMNCKPDLKTIFFSDPALALRCFFGPCVPAQYRLQGRGKCNQAPHIIRHTYSKVFQPTKTRTRRIKHERTEEANILWMALVFIGIVYFFLFYIRLPFVLYSLL